MEEAQCLLMDVVCIYQARLIIHIICDWACETGHVDANTLPGLYDLDL